MTDVTPPKDDTAPPAKTGRLVPTGTQQLGEFDMCLYDKCVDCGTTYPVIRDTAMCNGHKIDLCPWCRPDSRPWFRGRGL